MEVKSKK